MPSRVIQIYAHGSVPISGGRELSQEEELQPNADKVAGSLPHVWPLAHAVCANLRLISPFPEQVFSVLHTIAESRGKELATWSEFV